jgi:hypothetical protein
MKCAIIAIEGYPNLRNSSKLYTQKPNNCGKRPNFYGGVICILRAARFFHNQLARKD